MFLRQEGMFTGCYVFANFYLPRQIVYRRYASLLFICEISEKDNELITLELIHRYVEVLDQYFGNVRTSSLTHPSLTENFLSNVVLGL